MTVRDALPRVLRGEEGADLSPKGRMGLEDLGHQAQTEGLLTLLRDECAGRLKQPGAPLGVEYLLAHA